MKRIISYLTLFGFAACMFAACTRDEAPALPAESENSIRLGISGIERMTRAEDKGVESRVDRLDVLIFDAEGGKRHYERVAAGSVDEGVITLKAKRSDFTAGADYWVYLIANTSHAEADFEALTTRDGLLAMMQRDENIHMTGLSNVTGAPETFLMDGIAYPRNEAEPDVPGTVKLYDGVPSNDTELMVTLRRAAAKIVVHIRKGKSITFDDYETAASHGSGYYVRNLPVTTALVAGVEQNADVATPAKSNAGYFEWGVGDKTSIDEVRVTAYAYSHDWNDKSALDWEPRLVVNLPMWYHGEEGDADYNPDKTKDNFLQNSYYQIPICRPSVKRLERNRYYEVTVMVNAKGAVDASEPVELSPIDFSVEEWEEETIPIGGETDRPHYLMVNTDSLEMHNVVYDATSIEFASSSQVKVTVEESWFINKFGVKRPLGTGDVEAEPDAILSGHIGVRSPVPTNNAPRYIKLKVANEDAEVEPRYIIVIQYPLVYITNTQGYYSYREDFGGTTYEDRGENGFVSADYSWRGEWTYSTSYPQWLNSYYFTSKVAELKTGGDDRGKSDIYYYTWERTWGEAQKSNALGDDLVNARMYHVRIAASSGEYTLGIPRRNEEGYTASDDEAPNNSKVVSPSFLLASQLGATQTASSTAQAESHCAEYVETYVDDKGRTVHLTGWRLPTQYEIGVILGLQPGERENTDDMALDRVLTGDRYWSASGAVSTDNWHNVTNRGSYYTRCIRDVYDSDDL